MHQCRPGPHERAGGRNYARHAVANDDVCHVWFAPHEPERNARKQQALGKIHRRDDAVQPQRGEQRRERVVQDDRGQAQPNAAHERGRIGPTKQKHRELRCEAFNQPERRDSAHGRPNRRAVQEGAQVPALPVVFGIAAERAGHAEHRQRRREHQEAVDHLPLAQGLGRAASGRKSRCGQSRRCAARPSPPAESPR